MADTGEDVTSVKVESVECEVAIVDERSGGGGVGPVAGPCDAIGVWVSRTDGMCHHDEGEVEDSKHGEKGFGGEVVDVWRTHGQRFFPPTDLARTAWPKTSR